MRPAVVVIVTSVYLGCDPAEPKVETTRAESADAAAGAGKESAANKTETETAPETPDPTLDAQPTLERQAGMLNYKDTKGRTIFKNGKGDNCTIQLPFPPGPAPVPGMEPPRGPMACPEPMKDASWEVCSGATVTKTPEGCLCHWTGNPPPPPKPIDCPRQHDDAPDETSASAAAK